MTTGGSSVPWDGDLARYTWDAPPQRQSAAYVRRAAVVSLAVVIIAGAPVPLKAVPWR